MLCLMACRGTTTSHAFITPPHHSRATTKAIASTGSSDSVEDTSDLSDYPSSSTSTSDEMAFPSSTYLDNEGQPRGFSNWLIPNRLMVGRYPHVSPVTKAGAPSPEEAWNHHVELAKAGCNIFLALQEELPAQDDDEQWPASTTSDGFSRYHSLALDVNRELGNAPPSFLRFPIQDFCTPDSMAELMRLLLRLRDRILLNDDVVYVHCWGGRGRAGTVGACLQLLLADSSATSAEEALELVQRGYETREGVGGVTGVGGKSPETEQQREFVRAFAREIENDRSVMARE
jgi:hypothetical protein